MMFEVRYGVGVVRYEPLVMIEPAPGPTPMERTAGVIGRVGWAITCIFGAIIACVLLAALSVAANAPSLAGVGSVAIGFLTFMVWDSRRP